MTSPDARRPRKEPLIRMDALAHLREDGGDVGGGDRGLDPWACEYGSDTVLTADRVHDWEAWYYSSDVEESDTEDEKSEVEQEKEEPETIVTATEAVLEARNFKERRQKLARLRSTSRRQVVSCLSSSELLSLIKVVEGVISKGDDAAKIGLETLAAVLVGVEQVGEEAVERVLQITEKVLKGTRAPEVKSAALDTMSSVSLRCTDRERMERQSRWVLWRSLRAEAGCEAEEAEDMEEDEEWQDDYWDPRDFNLSQVAYPNLIASLLRTISLLSPSTNQNDPLIYLQVRILNETPTPATVGLFLSAPQNLALLYSSPSLSPPTSLVSLMRSLAVKNHRHLTKSDNIRLRAVSRKVLASLEAGTVPSIRAAICKEPMNHVSATVTGWRNLAILSLLRRVLRRAVLPNPIAEALVNIDVGAASRSDRPARRKQGQMKISKSRREKGRRLRVSGDGDEDA